MSPKDINEKFKNIPFFFDGAFGTYYNNNAITKGPCELANITHPELVYNVHSEYIKAGVNGIKTNSFGANIINFPDREQLSCIIRSSFEIAKRATKGSDVVVFADIGFIDSNDLKIDLSFEYAFIAQEFVNLGLKHFIFETMSEYEPLLKAISYIKQEVLESIIIVSFASMQDGYTGKGLYYKNLIKAASSNPDIDICGLNCLCGPTHLFNLIADLPAIKKPICAMPNSGYPATINGRTVFVDNAEYFGQKIKEIFELGVDFLGGCCGTTPEHIKFAIELIKKDTLKLRIKKRNEPSIIIQAKGKDILEDKKIKCLIAVEIDPPAGTNVDFFINASRKVFESGANIITVADSPLARAKADSIMLSAKIKREVGIDVIPHLSCRDKNHIGIKSVLLGACIEGVNNVLAITGDPVSSLERSEVKGVFSFNSFGLISYINKLNEEIFSSSPFKIGAALNVNANNFETELNRAIKKEQLGASIFLTQPVFTSRAIENIKKAKKILNAKILGGILPVSGYKNALFLNNEVSGIDIPDEFVQSLKDISKEESDKIVFEFTMNLIKELKAYVDGYYIMLPLKRVDSVCNIIKSIGEIF